MSKLKKIVFLISALALFSAAVVIAAFVLSNQTISEGTFLIEADGSVEPRTMLIQRAGNLYTLTGDINGSIIVERNNIVIDGAGCTLRGKSWIGYGISVLDKKQCYNSENDNQDILCGDLVPFLFKQQHFCKQHNRQLLGRYSAWFFFKQHYFWKQHNKQLPRHIFVDHFSEYNTVSGNEITNNSDGISFVSSSNNSIFGNHVANKDEGIRLEYSNYNSFAHNNLTKNGYMGIGIYESSYNRIFENNITANNDYGIRIFLSSNSSISRNYISANKGNGVNLYKSSTNNITENRIANNGYGIRLENSSGNNFHHNNFMDNEQQILFITQGYANIWDDGYPSGGNYWSDYETRYSSARELDESGVWNSPYVIDKDNQDNYPLLYESA
jgi:parallel beta-helix repeat protein